MARQRTFLTLIFAIVILFKEINGHGMMLDPVSRSSAWRKGFKVPPNYTDNQLFCGGMTIQYQKNDGKCGLCGDDYSLPRPRPNENGGIYGTGVIVQEYKADSEITITVRLTASHLGYFEFSICPLNYTKELETDACFAQYPLKLGDGSYRYEITSSAAGLFEIPAYLPEGLTCEHCVLRWHYRTGNNWGICEDGSGALGCGDQETFVNCADVSII